MCERFRTPLPRLGDQYLTLRGDRPPEIHWQSNGKTILGHVNWPLAEALQRDKELES